MAAITPWNYPLHQIALKVAPALAAGCTVALKPSEVAPLNAFVLAEMPEKPPEQALSNLVAYLSCDPAYTRGLHPITALDIRPGNPGTVNAIVPLPKDNKDVVALVKQAGFLVTSSTCKKLKWPQSVYADFKRAAKRGNEDLWVRRLDAPGLHDLEREHGVAPPP